MQEINAWLSNSDDFETGKQLYIKYGDNSFFKKTLESYGPTPYNIKKLSAELTALAPAEPAIIDKPTSKIEQSALAHPDTDEPVTSPDPKDTERYLSLKELRSKKYRQIDHNMAALAVSSDQHYRHMTAKQILLLHSQIQDIYRLTDYFDDYNKFPDILVKDEILRTPAEKLQKLWESTSKAKKRLASGKCRNIHKTEKLILKNELKIAELKRKDSK